MRVLNIGGTGFIGSRVTRKLVERGIPVVCMDAVPNLQRLAGLSVPVLQGDVTDFADVIHACQASEADRIVNCAYLLSAEAEANPLRSVKVNCLGMTNAFEAARVLNLERVVYASSIAVYGDLGDQYRTQPVKEDVRMPAMNSLFPYYLYSSQKQLNEYLALEYNRLFGTRIFGVRPGAVVGAGRLTGAMPWISDLLRAAANGQPYEVPSPPDERIPWVYVDDVAEALVRLLVKDEPRYNIYNVVNETITVEQLVGAVKEVVPDLKVSYKVNGRRYPVHDSYVYDNSRSIQDLGMTYTTLADAIHQMLEMSRTPQ